MSDFENTNLNDNENDNENGSESTYHYVGDPYRGDLQSSQNTNTSENQNSYYSGYSTYDPQPPKRKNKVGGFFAKAGRLVGAGIVFGLCAGITFGGVSIVKDQFYKTKSDQISLTTAADSTKSADSSETASAGTVTASSNDNDITQVVADTMPSVVSITSTIEEQTYFYGTQEATGAGSGFIIAKTDDSLMIATNNHVIEDAKSLTVGFIDDTTASATVVGKDSTADLAVISVKLSDLSKDTLSKIKVATLGNSDDLMVGETVIAIGNALGYGQSVTKGVISAKDREVDFTDGTMTLLQTDVAINPGNSGGVLINTKGEVVGINNAKLEDTSVEGMCYAIPISTASTILNDIMNHKEVAQGEEAYLGIKGRTIDSTYSEALGMPTGIYVTQIVSGSPAETAGINAGDIIVSFDGKDVSTVEGLSEKIALKEAGAEVSIVVKRANQNGEYEEKTIKVTLGKKSDYQDASDDSTESSDNSQSDSNSGSYGYGYGDDGSNGYGYDFGSGNDDSGSDYYNNPFYYFFGNGSGDSSSGGYSFP